MRLWIIVKYFLLMSFLRHHSSKEREMASHFCETERVMEIQFPYVDSMDTWNPYPHGLY